MYIQFSIFSFSNIIFAGYLKVPILNCMNLNNVVMDVLLLTPLCCHYNEAVASMDCNRYDKVLRRQNETYDLKLKFDACFIDGEQLRKLPDTLNRNMKQINI